MPSYSMVLSDDKVSHLSHVILSCLKNTPAVRLTGNEELALRGIKDVLASVLAEEEQTDRSVRARLASYSRRPMEGSPEWEIMYRKLFEEESRKRHKL